LRQVHRTHRVHCVRQRVELPIPTFD
jgi:hypothetical protein